MELSGLLSEIQRYQENLSLCMQRLTEGILERKSLEAQKQEKEDALALKRDLLTELEKQLEVVKNRREEKKKQLFGHLRVVSQQFSKTWLCLCQTTTEATMQPASEKPPNGMLPELANGMLPESEEGLLSEPAEDILLETATDIWEKLGERLEQLLEALADNQKRLSRKQELETQIPKKQAQLQKLAKNIQDAEVTLERLRTQSQARAEKINSLLSQLGTEKKEQAEETIRSLVGRKKELEDGLKEAQESYTECRTKIERLLASIETLKSQLSDAGEAGTVPEETVLERKAKLQQEKLELRKKRDQKKHAFSVNQDIYRKVKEKQEDIVAVEKKYTWMHALADTANGTLNGKPKIELETYIQMAYFDRILLRANRRLLTMSSGQYELKREESGNLKEKAGLELCVIDHYNATQRSVKTLSGGETFEASLSLALGLSDEIQSYAGGIQMDSMFVDEGFGSLDEEALNQAMKALVQLTEGNRLVGVISHVSELKEQIDRKIIVTKRREKDGGVHSLIEFE